MDLAPKLDALMQTVDVPIGVAVPAFADDHEMMGVVYRFNSMEHWGTSVDQMVENEEFTDLVSKANELGTLTTTHSVQSLRLPVGTALARTNHVITMSFQK